MDINIPSAAELRAKLSAMPQSDLESLAARSGVPLPTLVKIRYGQTENPRLETVRLIWAALPTAEAA